MKFAEYKTFGAFCGQVVMLKHVEGGRPARWRVKIKVARPGVDADGNPGKWWDERELVPEAALPIMQMHDLALAALADLVDSREKVEAVLEFHLDNPPHARPKPSKRNKR